MSASDKELAIAVTYLSEPERQFVFSRLSQGKAERVRAVLMQDQGSRQHPSHGGRAEVKRLRAAEDVDGFETVGVGVAGHHGAVEELVVAVVCAADRLGTDALEAIAA